MADQQMFSESLDATLDAASVDLLHGLLCSEDDVSAAAVEARVRAQSAAELDVLDAIAFHAELTASGLMLAVGRLPADVVPPPRRAGLEGCLMTSLQLGRQLRAASSSRPRGALHQFTLAWLEHRGDLVVRWGAAAGAPTS